MTAAEKQIELDNLEKALGQIQDAIKKIENTEAEAPPAPSDTKALWQEKIAESDGVIFVTNKLTSIECIDALIAEGYFDLTDDIWVKPFESWFGIGSRNDGGIAPFETGIKALLEVMLAGKARGDSKWTEIRDFLRAIALTEKENAEG
jgi:hypothetical protein